MGGGWAPAPPQQQFPLVGNLPILPMFPPYHVYQPANTTPWPGQPTDSPWRRWRYQQHPHYIRGITTCYNGNWVDIYVSGFAKRDLLGLCKRISTGVNSREIEISRKCGLLHHYNLWRIPYLLAKFETRSPFLRLKRGTNSFNAVVILLVYGLYRKCNTGKSPKLSVFIIC